MSVDYAMQKLQISKDTWEWVHKLITRFNISNNEEWKIFSIHKNNIIFTPSTRIFFPLWFTQVYKIRLWCEFRSRQIQFSWTGIMKI